MTLKVAILDMQPIIPAIGGGRLRLLGLYHALGAEIEARYVGTYDWPGEKYRKHKISSGLEETTVPLSPAHFEAARQLSIRANGKNVIDLAFPVQGLHSIEYLNACRDVIFWADVVVFSHPWVYPLMKEHIRPSQLLVYESHNVEGLLRAQILDESDPVENQVLRDVVKVEYELCRTADLVLACSQEDLLSFARLYEVETSRIRVVPNGVMIGSIKPPSSEGRLAARDALQVSQSKQVALFLGSDYPPNIEAAKFVVEELSPIVPEVLFVIAGGVGARVSSSAENVLITGVLDEKVKGLWLQASDIALNPMFSGSGTNIKMFDFMGAGLATVTTEVGARGIVRETRETMLVVEPQAEAFANGVRRLTTRRIEREKIGRDARTCTEETYAWEGISRQVGEVLKKTFAARGRGEPRVTVVVPTYERHHQLTELMDCLRAQTFREFEVVVVDQSAKIWERGREDFGFPMYYWHTEVRGAVRARNTGAFLSRGDVIAFTDDDCRPSPDWLLAAMEHFESNSVVGVEGLIESDHLNEPDFRPVTNVDFEGIGFMTANLLVRARDFMALGGFDIAFDRPHFREDTDFGWRLQDRGDVPYCRDVKVFHPAQPRSIEREAAATRVRLFEKDALLFAKHPTRYLKLFKMEGHWKQTRGFWEHFSRGGLKYNVDLSCFDSYFRQSIFEA